MISIFVIPFKAVVEELAPALVGGHASAFHVGNGRNVVIDVERKERFSTDGVTLGRSPDEFQWRLWRVRFPESQFDEGLVHIRQRKRRRQGMLDGKVSQMIFDGLVQVATERVGRGERAPGVPHRDESVSVHDVNLAGREVHGTLRDLTRHVGGIIVDDQGICIHAHACQQPTGFAMAGLDVGDVRHAASEHGGALVDHPLKHKGVDTVIGPSMANRQGFDDEQGKVPFDREVHRMLEGEVVCCPPG